MKTLIIVFSLILAFSCQPETKTEKVAAFPNRNLDESRYNVGFLVMDGTFNTEFTAPFDIYQHTIFRENIKAMNVFTVAASLEPVTTFEGVTILPDFSYRDDNLPKIDILVVPSAEHHLNTDLENMELLDFVRQVSEDALFVTSHCDGAFVLAKAGVLDGIESATFPGDIGLYRQTFPDHVVHDSVLFVHDKKFITSAGGARSFDASLYLIELLYGKEVANSIAEGLVIDWNLENTAHLVVSPLP